MISDNMIKMADYNNNEGNSRYRLGTEQRSDSIQFRSIKVQKDPFNTIDGFPSVNSHKNFHLSKSIKYKRNF